MIIYIYLLHIMFKQSHSLQYLSQSHVVLLPFRNGCLHASVRASHFTFLSVACILLLPSPLLHYKYCIVHLHGIDLSKGAEGSPEITTCW